MADCGGDTARSLARGGYNGRRARPRRARRVSCRAGRRRHRRPHRPGRGRGDRTRPREVPARIAEQRHRGARRGAGLRGHAARRARQGAGHARRAGARRPRAAAHAAGHGRVHRRRARPLPVRREGGARGRHRSARGVHAGGAGRGGDSQAPDGRRRPRGAVVARGGVARRARDPRRPRRQRDGPARGMAARAGRGARERVEGRARGRSPALAWTYARAPTRCPRRSATCRSRAESPVSDTPVGENRLARETSPYLLQHAHNPVDWYPWGEEAFARAKAEDKPILLSVGYSACHWCHVMERESFENADTAAVMNRHFVSIKVDREERPDVDHIYMQAVQTMTGQGGWPMTVFLTPDGTPFYGGTYFPPADRHGLPGFPRLLQALAEAWTNRRADVLDNGRQLAGSLGQESRLRAAGTPRGAEILFSAFQGVSAQFVEEHGGLGGAPKFPQPMIWEFVLRFARRSDNPYARRMVHTTLVKMARGGMYDQLGGGFARYSVDPLWLVPHFEKMLYDNAQLASLFLHAWQAFADPECRRIAEETLDYILREMTDPAGGFYSAQDADSEGHEGKFFVWSMEELREALGEADARAAAQYWGVDRGPNFEGKNILSLAGTPDPERIAPSRKRLYETRERRVHPGLDDKVLAAWNGLACRAFAEAGRALR